MSDWPLVAPNDDGIRPAGPADECFYCQQKVGTPHAHYCVIVHKKVRLRYTFEVEVDVPHSWDKDDVEHHRNESIWCANNAVEELEALSESDCLCDRFTCEFVEVTDDTPIRQLQDEAQMRANDVIRQGLLR